jgi:NADPH2:quinone reductase
MKALVCGKAHTLDNFAIKLDEIEEPTLRDFDVLVNVQAVGVNCGETWIRRTRIADSRHGFSEASHLSPSWP